MKALYSVDEFATEFCVCKTKIYALLKSGDLVARKIGRRTVIPAQAAEAWVSALPEFKTQTDPRPTGRK